MLNIRAASENEFKMIRAFYHFLIDAMKNAKYTPGWKKGIYPTDEYLRTSIEKRELFIGESEGKTVAAMIVNHDNNEDYAKVQWTTQATAEEITVIHALGVHPDFGGRGYAKEMVGHVIETAKQSKQKALRLDVLKGNLPAEKLYTSIGFQLVDTVTMYYADTGWTDYELYEYRL